MPTGARRQRVCILGSTGSVGVNTLDVIARHPDHFEVYALTAHSRVDELFDQCVRWRPRYAALGDARSANALRERLKAHGVRTEVLDGAAALADLAAHPYVDAVMAAIVGAAGLAPCLAAARAGKRLLLANKEALVVGGAFFMNAVRDGGAMLLPIDSEHSAIFQCLPEDRSVWPQRIDHILLTASGGPFRERDPATLAAITPDEACAHPNFVMGRKISVDSATMMNKALEVIEARCAGTDPRRDPPAADHPFDGRVPRQLGACATRHARHARADRVWALVPAAHRVGSEPARLWRARHLELRSSRA